MENLPDPKAYKHQIASGGDGSEAGGYVDNEPNAEELLEQYKIVANSISDIFFILDTELRFTFLAPSVKDELHYHFSELIGREFDDLVPEWSNTTLKKKLNFLEVMHHDIKEPQRFSIQLSGKYGKLNWYEVQISGIFNNANELKGYNGLCRDISERIKYEEALKLAKKKAEESDNLKSAFLANMSHEIRTPLNGIIGFSTMLVNREVPDDKKSVYADYIISSSKQLLTLVSDIIDISKIEAGQLSVFCNEVNVVDLLKELKETILFEKERLDKQEVRIVLNIPIREEISFVTDEIRLKQVLLNFLSNALKFTNNGKIEFGCDFPDKKNILFYVTDSGNGIPPYLQKVVFERFRQGDVDEKEKVAGTGLGLAISKGLIELMGGKIGVESKEGVGSKFYFTLPYK